MSLRCGSARPRGRVRGPALRVTMVRDPLRQLVVADFDFFLLGDRVDDERTERAFLRARANLVGAVAHPFGRVLARHPRADQRHPPSRIPSARARESSSDSRHFDRVALDHEVEQSLARAQSASSCARCISCSRTLERNSSSEATSPRSLANSSSSVGRTLV